MHHLWRGGPFVTTRPLGTRPRVGVEPLEGRLLFAAGDLDTTFGGGDGVADTDLAGRVSSIAFTDDGSIVVVGSTPRDDEGSIVVVGSPPSGGQEPVLVRYTPDGRLDTRFAAGGDDGDGRIVVHGLGFALPGLAKVDPEGRILVTVDGGDPVRLLRFNADGTRDMGFGEEGVAYAWFGHGPGATVLRILDDGKILMGARGGPAPAPGAEAYDASARFNPDGSNDLSYGPGGMANIFVPPEDTGRDRIAPYNVHLPDPFTPSVSKGATATSPPNGTALQADGKIVALDQAVADGNETILHQAVLRFNADGTLDATFAHAVHFPDGWDYLIAVQPGTGRILYSNGGKHFELIGLASGPPLETPRVVPPADATGPTATVISVPHVTAPTTSPITFTVRYEDDAGILDSSIDDDDIIVDLHPGSPSRTHVVSVVADGTARDVTYSVPYIGSTAATNGTYRLWLGSAEVFDTNGNAALRQENLGSFTVDIPADVPPDVPVVPPVEPPVDIPVGSTPGPNLAAGAVTASLRNGGAVLAGRRPAGRASVVINNAGTLLVRGRVRVTLVASADGTLDASDVPVAVRLTGVLLRPGRARQIRLRLGRIPAAMAAGSYSLLASVEPVGRLTETTAADNVSTQSGAAIQVVAPREIVSAKSPSRRRPGNDLFATVPMLPT
jgi:uncharacterized delta-60 repeat protein